MLWETSTGRLIREYSTPDQQFADIVFSPDGKLIAATRTSFKHVSPDAVPRDTSVVAWDVASGQRLADTRSWTSAEVAAWGAVRSDAAAERAARHAGVLHAISADGRLAVSLSGPSEKQVISISDLSTSSLAARLPGPFAFVTLMNLSSDGHLLAVYSSGALQVWDLVEKRKLVSLANSDLQAVAFSPDGKWLVGANGGEEALRVYTTANWRALRRIPIDADTMGGVRELVFSRDSRKIAVSGTHLWIYDVETGQLLVQPHAMVASVDEWTLRDGMLAVARSPKPRPKYAESNASVEIWPLSGTMPQLVSNRMHDVSALVISPNGRSLAATLMAATTVNMGRTDSYAGGYAVWTLDAARGDAGARTKALIVSDSDDTDPAQGIAFTADGDSVTMVTFAPQPVSQYAESAELRVRLDRVALSTAQASTIAAIDDRDRHVTFVSLSPLGDIALVRRDSVLRALSTSTGRSLLAFRPANVAVEHNQYFSCAGTEPSVDDRFSPSGHLVAISRFQDVVVVDARDGRTIRRFGMGRDTLQRALLRTYFLDDSTLVALSCVEGVAGRELELLNVKSGAIHSRAQFETRVDNALVLGDSSLVTHENGVLRVLGPRNELAATLLIDAAGEWLVVTPTGQYDASARGTALAAWRDGDRLLAFESASRAYRTPGLLRQVFPPRAWRH